MSIITVQLDVMQTWYFDYTMRKCFVVREHTNDDTIGNNLIEENLATGITLHIIRQYRQMKN